MKTELLTYGDKVIIKDGFYKGCQGILTDYINGGWTGNFDYREYEVEIKKIDENNYNRTKLIKTPIHNVEKI